MANAGQAPYPTFRSFLADGTTPNAGGKVYFYEAGTSTPKNTQVSRTGANNANPVVLDSAGEAQVWYLTGQYKVVEKTSADVTLRTVDEVSAAGDLPTLWTESGANIYRSTGQVYIGATSGGETLTVVGDASISTTLAVTGTTSLNGDVSVRSGMLSVTASAGVVVNEASSSVGDFRAESSTDTHFLFLDASGETLHIGGTGTGDIARFTPSAVEMVAHVDFLSTATLVAATTARSSVNMPHGTAPSSPTNGDMWTTTAGLYVRINGSTVGPLS